MATEETLAMRRITIGGPDDDGGLTVLADGHVLADDLTLEEAHEVADLASQAERGNEPARVELARRGIEAPPIPRPLPADVASVFDEEVVRRTPLAVPAGWEVIEYLDGSFMAVETEGWVVGRGESCFEEAAAQALVQALEAQR